MTANRAALIAIEIKMRKPSVGRGYPNDAGFRPSIKRGERVDQPALIKAKRQGTARSIRLALA